MIAIPIIAGAILLFLLAYLIAIKPGRLRKGKLDSFKGRYIAHRGLFNKEDIPENSMKAFRTAVRNGYGIELDVQLTADERLVVFHDADLKRMCGINKNIADCTYEELLSYDLGKSTEKIPLFRDVIAEVEGKVPLLIEIKPHRESIKTTKTLAQELRGYNGSYAVQSFNPMAVEWYKRNEPQVPRGILATNFRKNKVDKPFIVQFILTNLLCNFYAKPDFIAYNHKYADEFSFKLCRRLYKFEKAAWTIRSEKDLARAKSTFDIFIFDSFIPHK